LDITTGSPRRLLGIVALPTLRSFAETSMVGALENSSAQMKPTPRTPMIRPTRMSNGSEIITVEGKRTKTAANVPKLGRTRSRYCIWLGFSSSLTLNRLRWESMTDVPVLISASPGFEPSYAKAGDAGADLRSTKKLSIAPGSRELVPTGVSIALPAGFVGLVHPRSGLALKNGVTVLNSPGTIDAGYRGEIMVTLFNSSSEVFEVEIGDRIAQLLIQSVERAKFISVDRLPDSDRGQAGFGSTGKS